MIRIRRSEERGRREFGWLSARHTFSFGSYRDPAWMGFRHLRVLNEDWIQPGKGFPMHPHEDMEIVTYVLEGALRHKDSTGGGGVIEPWVVQRMSAGTGIRHSEFNASQREPVHLLQIWILPNRRGHKPSYEEKTFLPKARENRLCLVASPDGAAGSVRIHQDARLYGSVLEKEKAVELALGKGRHAWIQVARGRVRVNGKPLDEGDGAGLWETPKVAVEAIDGAEFLLFDLP